MKTIRKTGALLLVTLLLCCLLAGCGSSAMKDTAASAPAASDPWAYDSYEESAYDSDYSYDAKPEEAPVSAAGSTAQALVGNNAAANFAEKLIYTASADIETLDFDKSVDSVQVLMGRYNAFLESSFVSGNSYDSQYYGYSVTRHASFTIRVPKENYSALTGALNDLGNVTGINTSVENITERYSDTDSRLQTYRTEESRLLAMLEKAETVEDMLAIESRLSEVRYNIESLTSTLRGWDNEINYSKVYVNLYEVERLSRQIEPQRTYGEKMLDGLKDSLSGIGNFFSDLLLWLVAALPVLILLAVIAVILLLIIRACRKRIKAKRKPRFNPADGTPVDPKQE